MQYQIANALNRFKKNTSKVTLVSHKKKGIKH